MNESYERIRSMKFYRRKEHGDPHYYESESDPTAGIAGFEIESPRNGYGWQVRVMRYEITPDDFARDNRLAGREFKTLREAKAACESHAVTDRVFSIRGGKA
jgi:hypothetical protein